MATPDLNTYSPSNLHVGGTRVSISYLKAYWSCPFQWYMEYLAPHPQVSGSAGLQPMYGNENLLIGAVVHEAMFAYRLSGWRDGADTGEYDPDRACHYGEEHMKVRFKDWDGTAAHATALDTMHTLIHRYHEWHGQGDDLRVISAPGGDGEPCLEREFVMPLRRPSAPADEPPWLLTVKPDMVGQRAATGEVVAREYKTARARTLHFGTGEAEFSAQSHGETLVLHHHFGDGRLGPLEYLFLIKDYSPTGKTPPFVPLPVGIKAESLDAFRLSALSTLEEIDRKVTNWRQLVAEGADPYAAAHALFPMAGRGNSLCRRFGRDCDWRPYCDTLDNAMGVVVGYRPRSVEGRETEGEPGPAPEGW